MNPITTSKVIINVVCSNSQNASLIHRIGSMCYFRNGISNYTEMEKNQQSIWNKALLHSGQAVELYAAYFTLLSCCRLIEPRINVLSLGGNTDKFSKLNIVSGREREGVNLFKGCPLVGQSHSSLQLYSQVYRWHKLDLLDLKNTIFCGQGK